MSARLCAVVSHLAVLLICATFLVTAASAQYFETRADVPIGPPKEPASIAVGDFNNDGKLDLATTPNLISTEIAVMLGNGDGTFHPPVYYTVGQGPSSVAVADFNRDGVLDLAVVNSLGGTISILLGNGNGTFQDAMNIPAPSGSSKLVTGDFNNDGLVDLAIINGGVGIMLGKGDGTFQAAFLNTSFNGVTDSLTVGDFNHDGNLDVAVCGSAVLSDSVGVLLGNGDGTLQPAQEYAVGFEPEAIVSADFNGDGNLDLADVELIEGVLRIFLGNGDGTFRTGIIYSTGNPDALLTADLSARGRQDIAVATSYKFLVGVVTVFVGNGDGTFLKEASFPSGEEPTFVDFGDFNGDHRPDLVVADHLESAIFGLLNTGAVAYSPAGGVQFMPQKVGTVSQPRAVTMTNHGSSPVVISSISTTGDFHWSTTTCGRNLPAGFTCTISVTFQPPRVGQQRGYLKINDSASTKPQIILLSGKGTM